MTVCLLGPEIYFKISFKLPNVFESQVHIEKGEKELSVQVDNLLTGSSKAPRRLGIGNVMYVGGLPEQTMDFPEIVVRVRFLSSSSSNLFNDLTCVSHLE